ncbi:MAG: cell division protein ZapA [Lentihominibacter sp.]|jgi:cell division protein ZapA
MENNKVNVKIYGQEYTVTGDSSKEDIVKVAAYVDMKMHEIADAAKSAGATPHNVAILAAMNIANENLKTLNEIDILKQLNVQLEKDAEHYVQLWDESKKNYTEYKEETQAIVLQKDELMSELRAKDDQIAELKASAESTKTQMQSGMDDVIREVEGKCRELENSFFDLQMENLQLKKELEKYKTSL